MNLVIGAFFSEAGNHLLTMLVEWDQDAERIHPACLVASGWQHADFKEALRALLKHTPDRDRSHGVCRGQRLP